MFVARAHFYIIAVFWVATLHWQAYGRENILERDGKPVYISRRRIGQTKPAFLQRLREVCPDEICEKLATSAISSLLAAQPECSQQDAADDIIDASRRFDANTQASMIAIAIEFRQLEKNTPLDNSTDPPSFLNSVYCQRPPRNPELYGLVQAQDPANDPNLFFDPALKTAVVKGSQDNTFPFRQDEVQQFLTTVKPADIVQPIVQMRSLKQQQPLANCDGVVRVKVTGPPVVVPSGAVVVTYGNRASTAASPTPTASPPLPVDADFGECTVPEIEFGPGYDNRRETSFRPTDRNSFNHESALDISIITQFICDSLTNVCRANQIAKDLCREASEASLAAPDRTGNQADAFNNRFGIRTNFGNVLVRDDQGNVILASTTSSGSSSSTATASLTPSPTGGGTNNGGNNPGGNNNDGLGNFGSCALPKIDWGPGFDGTFQTTFRAAFGRTTSRNINVIADALCNDVATVCGGDATAVETCRRAQEAAAAAPNGTGAQADAFNAVFGIITLFSSIPPTDIQGRPITGNSGAPSPINNNGSGPQARPSSARSTGGGGVVVVSFTQTSSSTRTTATPATPTGTANGGANTNPNLQGFTGRLGNIPAPAVTSLGNGQFQVAGNAVINSQREAVIRSCNVQQNQCSDAANASGNQNGFTVAACGDQEKQCIAQAG